MKMRAFLALLFAAAPALAAGPHIRAGELELVPQSATPCASSQPCFYMKQSDGLPYWRKSDGTITGMTFGSLTLSQAYANGGAGPQIIAEDFTRTAIEIREYNLGSVIFSLASANGSGRYLDFTSGAAVFGVGVLRPLNDNISSSGDSTHRWSQDWAVQRAGAVQTIAAVSSLTLNPALGETFRITLSATAISSLTVNTGLDGQVITVEVIEDSTGTRTIPTTWTNVAFAGGTYTATTTANKRDVLTFRYNSTDAKWHEQSRAMNE